MQTYNSQRDAVNMMRENDSEITFKEIRAMIANRTITVRGCAPAKRINKGEIYGARNCKAIA